MRMKKIGKKRLRKKYFIFLQSIIIVFLIFSDVQILFLEQSFVSAYEVKIDILYDEKHSYLWFSSYSKVVGNLRKYYNVTATNQKLTFDTLDKYDVLIIATPIYTFSKEEIYDIKRFVELGGGLLLMGNGWYWRYYHEKPLKEFPFNKLGREFGVTINDDIIVDPTNYENDSYYPIFHEFAQNHPITENIKEIWTKNPCSLTLENNAMPIVWGDDDSYSGNIYSRPYKTGENPPVVAAVEYGKGRVVFIGADTFFKNDWDNVNSKDNLKCGLNIFSWLTGNKATISISSTPSNAKVYIKNEYKGVTPLKLKMNPGEYNIRIEKEGYESYAQTVELSPGGSKSISINLNLKKAELSISSNPNASVYINNDPRGNTPFKIELDPREYTIVIKKEKYEPYMETIVLSPGEKKDISITLRKGLAYYQKYIFGAIVVFIFLLVILIYITRRKPKKIPKKEKLSSEKEQIKKQIEEKKKYIANYRKIMKQDPTKKEMAERLIRKYEEEIKELEIEVSK